MRRIVYLCTHGHAFSVSAFCQLDSVVGCPALGCDASASATAERAGEAAPEDEPPIEMQREWVDAYDLLEALKSAEQQRVCVKCGHNNVNSKGECRQCIDWQKHECVFKEEGKEDGK